MFRFAIKAGIAGGAIYYLAEEGVWRSSTESIQAYEKLNDTVLKPTIEKLCTKVDVQLPKLPESNQIGYLTKQTWNKGVICTFEFLSKVPEHVSKWTNQGIEQAMKNPEIRKMFDSFNSTEPKPDVKN